MSLVLFIFNNVGIFLGGLFVGLLVVPRTTEFVRRLIPGVSLRLHATTLGALGFSLTCALIHLDLAVNVALYPDMSIGWLAQRWHMGVLHAAQIVSVWTLILGVLFEFVRPVSRALQRGDHVAATINS